MDLCINCVNIVYSTYYSIHKVIQNVQNNYKTIKYVYTLYVIVFFSQSCRRESVSVGRKTPRQVSFSHDLFVNDYLTNKRRKNIQASYVRKKVTAPFHALPWTRRTWPRGRPKASCSCKFHVTVQLFSQKCTNATCSNVHRDNEKRKEDTLVKNFFGASRPSDALIRSCVSRTYQVQYNNERYNIQVIPSDSDTAAV